MNYLHVKHGEPPDGGVGVPRSPPPRQLRGTRESQYIPPQFIDHCNSIRVGSVRNMDKAGEVAEEEFKLTWDREKEWKNGVHLGVHLDSRKHWKYRTTKVKAAWQPVRRLTREQKRIVVSMILPPVTYGSELHHERPQDAQVLAAELNRFIVGAWRGSSREKIAAIVGMEE